MAEIKLVRIDFRLIHGQIVNKWIKVKQCNRIIVIDDTLAKNDFMKKVYIMAAPPGVKVDIFTIDEAVKEWQKDQFGNGELLILFKNVSSAAMCYKKGFHYSALQIGGLGAAPGRKLVFGPITLDKADFDSLIDLQEQKVKIIFHQVPDEKSETFESIAEKVKF